MIGLGVNWPLACGSGQTASHKAQCWCDGPSAGMNTVYKQTFTIEGGDFGRAGSAASGVKQILKEIGLDNRYIKRAVIIAYEAEINVVSYATRGELTLTVSPRRIQIAVEDEGPGSRTSIWPLQEGYSTATDWIREMGFGAGWAFPISRGTPMHWRSNPRWEWGRASSQRLRWACLGILHEVQ